MEYQELPAAVVNLLLGDGVVTPKAIETTALEMVRKDRLRAEQKADGTVTVRPLPRKARPASMRPFEKLLVERVRHRCGNGVDRVPIGALGPGDGDEFWVWWRGFQRSVREEAMALKLIRPAREKQTTWLLRCALFAVAVGLFCAVLPWCPPSAGGFLVIAMQLGVMVVLRWPPFRLTSDPRLTAAGRQAAREWRNDTDAAEHRLPKRQVGAEGPESALPVREPRQIWSSYGRSWHVVDTEPLDPPRWGHTWQFVILSLTVCAVSIATVWASLFGHLSNGGVLAATPVLVGALLWVLWLPARRRVQAVPAEMRFHGVVICRWDYNTHYDDPLTDITHYCCAIEDPASHRAWSFEVHQWRRPMFSGETNPELKDRFRVGDVVDVHCSPRRRKVYRISVVEAVPR
ncbi:MULTISPECIES: DUF2207 family protein [Streptomyces]|uniref:DUF2207 family protein n=1 Tax=Streptomyces TaxID=1883 RepID=UPI000AE272BB|nr:MULTISPECIES: hypothetical protein [Streptomyces]